jgi:hypothetical protein
MTEVSDRFGTMRYRQSWSVLTPYAAPALLVVVAAVQFYRAHAYHQSPWKGGGFGMFSTIDQPSARFLRCYLVTPAGDVPVSPPDRLYRAIRRVRVVATQENLARVAQGLARSRWVRNDRPSEGVSGSSDSSSEAALDPPADTGRHVPRYRAAAENEADVRPEDQATFTAVRTELWRYRFFSDGCQLRATKWAEVIRQRSER